MTWTHLSTFRQRFAVRDFEGPARRYIASRLRHTRDMRDEWTEELAERMLNAAEEYVDELNESMREDDEA